MGALKQPQTTAPHPREHLLVLSQTRSLFASAVDVLLALVVSGLVSCREMLLWAVSWLCAALLQGWRSQLKKVSHLYSLAADQTVVQELVVSRISMDRSGCREGKEEERVLCADVVLQW